MKQAIRRQPTEITTIPPKRANNIICNFLFSCVVIIALIITLSLFTYHPDDSAWSKTFATTEVHNLFGKKGAYFSDIVFTAIGQAAWLIPIFLVAFAYRLIYKKAYKGLDIETVMIRILGVVLFLLAVASLLNLYNPNDDVIKHGGAIGQLVGILLNHSVGWLHNLFPDSFISIIISKIILFAFLFITAIMVSGCGPLAWIDFIGATIINSAQFAYGLIHGKEKESAPDNTLANIEHLMQKDAISSEPSAPRFNLSSTFSKFKNFKKSSPSPIEPDHDAMHENNYKYNAHDEENLTTRDRVTKQEPTLANSTIRTTKTEPILSVATNTATNLTPQFEPQTDEEGQPKLPSIFKRPTIKSEPQDANVVAAEQSMHTLSSWANELTAEPVNPTNINSIEEVSAPETDTLLAEAPAINETIVEQTSEIKLDPTPIDETFFDAAPKAMIEEQPTISQPRNYADYKPNLPRAGLHESDQDFNAFLETLEKYHSPESREALPTATFEIEPTKDIIHDALPEATELISDSHMTFDAQNSDISLPEISEIPTFSFIPADEDFVQPIHETAHEPLTASTKAEPIWTPFEPVETFDEPKATITPPVIEAPKANIVMPQVKIPTEMSANKKAELLKHFPMAGQLPPLSLLGDPPPSYHQYDVDELNDMAQLIEEQLKNFSIRVKVANIEPGPVVTRFELDLAPGVKVSQINNLDKDIARGLSVTSVRVVDIIPGTSYVGLEIPNKKREIVYFKSGLESEQYQNSEDPLTLILGKSISGETVIANLAKMPHVLVAGTTGSGKSVGVNTMLLSMLFKARPEELRLILIDPKMLELSVYNDIPHLLIPVITDMKESANALRWCVAEMERRYMLMSQLKVRNIAGFNQKVQDAIDEGQPIIDPLWRRSEHVSDTENPPLLEKLPFIVVVIDEFADMMMLVGKKCEELIARLAQKARASGIHLILATQRPSVDVITGLIKANIPTRIAFQVSSKIDSRTIIDQQGAEALLGNGDMLYAPSGINLPIRVHGSFIDDHEVNKVAEFLKLTGEPDYIEDILQEPTEAIPGLSPEASGVAPNPSDEQDPLFDEAVKIVVESRRASISFIQRKLRVGYQRAARLMEEMEELRIVTPPQSNGNREVLMAAENDDY